MALSTTAPRRVVLVTGAAKRLGRVIALDLARQGWQVAVHYRGSEADAIKTAAECAELSGASGYFEADFQDEAAVRALLPRVVAQMGAVDAVVNSASLFEHDSAADFGYDAMLRHLRSNTGAPIVLAQALHQHTVGRGTAAQGVVVNMLDQKLWNMNPDFVSYTLSKAALEAATTLLAQLPATLKQHCPAPAQVPPALPLAAMAIDASVSVKAAAVSARGLGLASVKVMVEVPSAAIVAGANALAIVGGAVTTRLAFAAARLAPALALVTAPAASVFV